MSAWDNAFEPARIAAEVLGFTGNALTVIQMQFLREKGDAYWESYPAVSEFNFSNTKITAERLGSPGAGIAAYAYTLLVSNPAAFGPFVAAGRAGNALAAAEALSDSPWADPPYGPSFVSEWESMSAVPEPAVPDEPEPAPASEPGVWVTVTKDEPGQPPSADGTLWGIAQGHGLTVQDILALNPGLTVDSVLTPGERIRIG